MATRFYLPSTGYALSGVGNIPSNQMGWNSISGDETAQFMYTTKKNSTLTTTTLKTSDVTSGWRHHRVKRFVSEPLSAQTISGTISGIIQCYESSTSLNGTLAIAVYRVDSDGDYQDTLLAITYSDSTSSPYELYSSLRSRYWYNSSESNSISLTSRSFSAGDRLVIEIGFAESNTTSSRGAYFRFGDPTGSTDFTTYDQTTNTYCPWIEFSADITFQPTTKSVSDSSGGVSKNRLPSNVANGCESGATTGWTENDNDGNLTVTADTSDEYSGSYCLKLAVSGDTASYNFVDTALIPVTPSTYYTVSARAKISSGTYLLGIQWYDSGMGYLTEEYGTFTNNSYTQVYFTKQLPSNAYYVKIFFTIIPGTGARTLCGDEFQLEQNSTYTSWEDPASVGTTESIGVVQLTSKSGTDSGSGGDTLTPEINIPLTDSLTITEVSSLKGTIPLTDSTTGSGVLTLLHHLTGITSTSVGSDTLLLKLILEVLTDLGVGSDLLDQGILVPVIEVGSGGEVLSLNIIGTLNDTGAASDLLGILNHLTGITSTGIGTDSLTQEVTVPGSDTGVGADQENVKNSPLIPETGAYTDTLSTILNHLTATETSNGAENLLINLKLTLGDGGSSLEGLTLQVGASVQDTTSILEDLGVGGSTTKSLSESLHGVDSGLLSHLTLTTLDSLAGVDTPSLRITVTPSDLTSNFEALSVTVSPVITEVGSGQDTTVLYLTKGVSDTSLLSDIAEQVDNSIKHLSDSLASTDDLLFSRALSEDVVSSILVALHKIIYTAEITARVTIKHPRTGVSLKEPYTGLSFKHPVTGLTEKMPVTEFEIKKPSTRITVKE